MRKKEHHYKLGVVFNLIERKIEFEHKSEYSKVGDNREYLYIEMFGGNYKKIYASFEFKNVNKLFENNLPDIKLKLEEIDKNYKNNRLWQITNLFTEEFYEKKDKAYILKSEILENTFGEIKNINYMQEIYKKVGVETNAEIVLVYPIVKFPENGLNHEITLAKLEKFQKFYYRNSYCKISGNKQDIVIYVKIKKNL